MLMLREQCDLGAVAGMPGLSLRDYLVLCLQSFDVRVKSRETDRPGNPINALNRTVDLGSQQ